MNQAMTRQRVRSRTGAWWIADEEPEILLAERSPKLVLSRIARQRVAVLIGLALAAGISTLFLV